MEPVRRDAIRTRLGAGLLCLAGLLPSGLRAQDCGVSGQNEFVADVMDEFYFWYQEMPAVDPTSFESPDAYLDAVRFPPPRRDVQLHRRPGRQRRVSTRRASSSASASASRFVGNVLRIAQVFPESPASEAGLARGDTVLAIDGVSVEELLETGQFSGVFGPPEEGQQVELRWRTLAGDERSAVMVKRIVTIPTVSQTAIFEIEGRLYGYIHFRNFVRPSIDALNNAFAEMRIGGVQELGSGSPLQRRRPRRRGPTPRRPDRRRRHVHADVRRVLPQ